LQLLSPIAEDNDDTISIYVFGEDEAELEDEARKHGGFLKHEHLARQYGNGSLQNVRFRRHVRRVLFTLHASEKPISLLHFALAAAQCIVIGPVCVFVADCVVGLLP